MGRYFGSERDILTNRDKIEKWVEEQEKEQRIHRRIQQKNTSKKIVEEQNRRIEQKNTWKNTQKNTQKNIVEEYCRRIEQKNREEFIERRIGRYLSRETYMLTKKQEQLGM